MNNDYRVIIESYDKLSQSAEIKSQARKVLPVPSDFKIIWASTGVNDGNPCGFAITDQGLVIKSKTRVISQGKKKGVESPYKIVMWDSYDPDDFRCKQGSEGIIVTYADVDFECCDDVAIACFFKDSKEQSKRRNEMAANAAQAEINNLGLKDIVFAAGRGADQHPAGHGEFAEKAGVLLDRAHGDHAQHVGADNAKNGPDKIVNGQSVQCKYCKTGYKSVSACFAVNSEGKKEFRYFTSDKKPMMIEVPKDQYEQAIEAMKNRIKNGEVPDVTDPEKAYEIIRKGRLTYQQAKNLAKAGTFESLAYDAVTGAVNCAFAFGITALVSFGFEYFVSKDPKKAAKLAAAAGLQTFGLSLAAQVLAAQIARTGLAHALIPAGDYIVRNLGYKTTQALINALRAIMGKAPIYGAAAAKSLAKALRGNAIVQAVEFVVFSAPNTYRIILGRMSTGEYFAGLANMLAGIAGTAFGTISAGLLAAKIAAFAGTAVVPGVGTVAGFVGGLFGGIIFNKSSSDLIKQFREDDTTIVLRIFNAGVMNACYNNMLTEDEMEKFLKRMTEDEDSKKAFKSLENNLYKSKTQYQDIEDYCDSVLQPILKERQYIANSMLPDEEEYITYLAEIIEEVSSSAE